MNKFTSILFASALVFAATSSTLAQIKNKFGHIDTQELLELMPERTQAEKDLQATANQLEKQLKTMSAEWESKVADYRANETVMTDLIKQTKAEEISNLEQRIQAFQQNAQESLGKRESELIQPILDKAKKAIEEVAQENGYTYIFDSSVGVLLFQPESDDVLPLVKKKLGITATKPAAPAPQN